MICPPSCASGEEYCDALDGCADPLMSTDNDSDSEDFFRITTLPVASGLSDVGEPVISSRSVGGLSIAGDEGPDENGCDTSQDEVFCELIQRCLVATDEICPSEDDDYRCNPGSTGLRWCETKQKCIRYSTGAVCPYCEEGQRWCYDDGQGNDGCYDPMDGDCEDMDGPSDNSNANSDEGNMDNGDGSGLNDHETEITAVATFKVDESGVEGTVTVDENGNVFIDLDISQLDLSPCEFGDDDVSFGYSINMKFDNELVSKNGPDQCSGDINGDIFNPFGVPLCDASNFSDDNAGDSYFTCAIGDLSGRFGALLPDEDNRLVIDEIYRK